MKRQCQPRPIFPRFSFTLPTTRRNWLPLGGNGSWQSSTPSLRRCSCTIVRHRGGSMSCRNCSKIKATLLPKKWAKKATSGLSCIMPLTMAISKCLNFWLTTWRRVRIVMRSWTCKLWRVKRLCSAQFSLAISNYRSRKTSYNCCFWLGKLIFLSGKEQVKTFSNWPNETIFMILLSSTVFARIDWAKSTSCEECTWWCSGGLNQL